MKFRILLLSLFFTFIIIDGGDAISRFGGKASGRSRISVSRTTPSRTRVGGFGHETHQPPLSTGRSSVQPNHPPSSAGNWKPSAPIERTSIQNQYHPPTHFTPPPRTSATSDQLLRSEKQHQRDNFSLNTPAVPVPQAPPIGFKDPSYSPHGTTRPSVSSPHQTHSVPLGNPYSTHPSGNPYPMHPPGNPYSTHLPGNPYPTHSPGNPYSTHPLGNPYSMHPPGNPYSTHPLGNPYSMHPPGNPYSTHPSGNPYPMHPPGNPYPTHTPGQTYYPTQPQVIAQPAAQPYIPGQTILMVPGQQNSGPGIGQLVKEALVYSTISAGVNRLINPHSHHYIETKPADSQPAATHITYNQYFNNGTTNPTNLPQAPPSNSYPGGNNPTPYNSYPGGNNPTPYNSYPGGNNPTPYNSYPGGNNPTLENTYPIFPTSGVAAPSSPNLSGSTAGTSGSNAATSQSNSPATSNNFDNTMSYAISDNELYKITEELFARSSLDLSKYVKLNLQTRVTSPNATDEAKEPLFYVNNELFDYPTISVTRSLYDDYEYDFSKKINRTIELRKKENLLLDTFLHTSVMGTATDWLVNRGFIDPDEFEKKDTLHRLWFTVFSGSSCGFERVFASENYGTAIVGVQNWLYFEYQESQKRLNYMGYTDKLDLGATASLIKLNFEMDKLVRPNATIFVGTLPEFEMALYTICFYARPNNLCPVSLGGNKFNIYTHSFVYFGVEVIDLGLPMF